MILSTRRQLLAAGAGLAAGVLVRPAAATPEELAAAIRAWTGGAPLREGRVKLDIASLVDNGNTVPVSISVDSLMSPARPGEGPADGAADYVRAIALFSERNPLREVAQFTLGPRAGRARVDTRIRLATTQKLVALARLSDGSCWSHTVEVIVTIAACLEEI